MMKAFVRQNYAEVDRARADAVVLRASIWENMHSSTSCYSVSTVGSKGGRCLASEKSCSPPSVFESAYEALFLQIKRRNQRTAEGEVIDGSGLMQEELSRDRLANAWETHNGPRVVARRFAGTHASVENPRETATIAYVAVIALTIAPMLIKRTTLMCDCDMDGIAKDAAEWVAFHHEAFEREFERMNARLAGGDGRAVRGPCECKKTDACSHLVRCTPRAVCAV